MHVAAAPGAVMDVGVHTGVAHAIGPPLALAASTVRLVKLPGRGLVKLKLPVVLMGVGARVVWVVICSRYARRARSCVRRQPRGWRCSIMAGLRCAGE